MKCLGRVLIVAGLCGLSGFARSSLEPPEAPQQVDATPDHAVARIHTQRVRFERRRGAPEGVCASMGAADLRVRLRGSTIDAPDSVRLDRERQPAVHALLIDTSSSLLGFRSEIREVARSYLAGVDFERDRALAMSFDDEPRLASPLTRDREALVAAIGDLRPGGLTVLHDALVTTAEELRGTHARGIMILLSDGVDVGSLTERRTVRDAVLTEHGPAVFVIGFQVPALSSTGRPGAISTRRFLQELAHDSGGAYFEAHHVSRLATIFGRVRELVAAEAVVEVSDPFPEAGPGKLEIDSRIPGCRVRRLDREGSAPERSTIDLDELSAAEALPTDPFRGRMLIVESQPLVVDPECAAPRSMAGERSLHDDGHQLRICVNSETMDQGVLFDAFAMGPEFNGWPGVKVRSLSVPVPPLADLPRDPVDALIAAAASARERSTWSIQRESRRLPEASHARPYHDQPALVGSRSFALLRPALALALAQREDYRAWLTDAVRDEVERELGRLERRLAALAPEASPEQLRQVMLQSPRAQELRARIAEPDARDAQGRLGAWLGDLSAHEGLARFEARACNELIDVEPRAQAAGEFVEGWLALRDLLWVPSYTRALGLLVPVMDAAERRVGFWRIMLPRVAWIMKRRVDHAKHPDWGDLPFDLVPDRPRAFEWLRDHLENRPDLRARLKTEAWRVGEIRYATRERFDRRDPVRAFMRSTATIEWVSADERVTLHVDTDLPTRRKLRRGAQPQVVLRAEPSGGQRATALAEQLLRHRRAADPSVQLKSHVDVHEVFDRDAHLKHDARLEPRRPCELRVDRLHS